MKPLAETHDAWSVAILVHAVDGKNNVNVFFDTTKVLTPTLRYFHKKRSVYVRVSFWNNIWQLYLDKPFTITDMLSPDESLTNVNNFYNYPFTI